MKLVTDDYLKVGSKLSHDVKDELEFVGQQSVGHTAVPNEPAVFYCEAGALRRTRPAARSRVTCGRGDASGVI
jgi:hypothetical protein